VFIPVGPVNTLPGFRVKFSEARCTTGGRVRRPAALGGLAGGPCSRKQPLRRDGDRRDLQQPENAHDRAAISGRLAAARIRMLVDRAGTGHWPHSPDALPAPVCLDLLSPAPAPTAADARREYHPSFPRHRCLRKRPSSLDQAYRPRAAGAISRPCGAVAIPSALAWNGGEAVRPADRARCRPQPGAGRR
jgi:hypothetical protein